MRTTYDITNGSGIVHTVQRGLVDSDGVFFYVTDTGEGALGRAAREVREAERRAERW